MTMQRKAASSTEEDEKDGFDVIAVASGKEDGNIGLDLFERAKEADVNAASDESRRIARKIDKFILPVLCITQGLSILDKSALNTGNLYGMKASLHINTNEFAWLGSLFYVGYLIGNYPDGWLVQHYHAGKVLGAWTMIWAVIVITTPVCHNYAGGLANRFFLGIFEAIVTPGLTLLTAVWYTRQEVPLRTLFWYTFNGWGGILGDFIGYGVGRLQSPSLARWKYIFFILGAITLAWGLFVWFYLPNSPVDAPFMNNAEKSLAVKRVAEGKVGMKNTQFKAYQVKEALLDPKTYLLFVASIAAQIPNGVVSNFSSIIIQGMGFTVLQTILLDLASNGMQIASLLLAGWICTRFRNMRVISMAIGNITCIISASCLTYLPQDQKWNRLVAFWFTSFQSVGFSLSLVMISNNVGGYTKKTFTTALTFVGYCIGNIIGPHFIKDSEAPRYQTGTTAMFVGYVIKTVCHLLLGAYMWQSNVKRDRKQGMVVSLEDNLKGEEAGMYDLTEFENPYHRYVL